MCVKEVMACDALKKFAQSKELERAVVSASVFNIRLGRCKNVPVTSLSESSESISVTPSS